VHDLSRDSDLSRGEAGGIVNGTVEGASWVGADRLVMVSDRATPGRHEVCCCAKEPSMHVFEIPQV
jgi:hypothetical protein